MADRAGDPEMLGRVEANRGILARLADGAVRSSDGVSVWNPDGWVMRTHPDLTEAVERAASGTELHRELVYGMASLVDPRSVIVVVGIGTGSAWMRVSSAPALDDAIGRGASEVEGLPGWLALEAWRIDLAAWVRASAILTRDLVRGDA